MPTLRLLCAPLLALSLLAAKAAPAQQAAQPPAPLTNQQYGPDNAQLADVYLPARASAATDPAPMLVMVHGGSWKDGDKATPEVIAQKLSYWLPKGYVVVSVNTRMLPQATPAAQAEDLGVALAWLQTRAPAWNADPARMIVMGHSSGGHLLALLAADSAMRQRTGAQPWLASVILDGAGFDLMDVMHRNHPSFYDEAFGTDPAQWPAASPVEHLSGNLPPALLVCSTLRAPSCLRSQGFADKLAAHGNQAQVIGVARNHGQINSDVGADNPETQAIAAFIDDRLQALAPMAAQ